MQQSISYLREIGFLSQGYHWTCSLCQHGNWVSLRDATETIYCEVCGRDNSYPVQGNENIHFKLNPFVASSLASGSSQGSVIWALTKLYDSASESFMFCPAVEITLPDSKKVFGDLDVLASVDGRVYLCEVKASFAGFDVSQLEKLEKVVTKIRPDFAGFAIQDKKTNCRVSKVELDEFIEKLKKIHVGFFLMTTDRANNLQPENSIPRAIGERMNWSI